MKKFVLACCLLLVVCTTAQAQIGGFDPTDAKQVAALHRCLGGASLNKANAPFRPVPNSDTRADGSCWEYQTDSNYHLGQVCNFSADTCIDSCLSTQDREAQQCSDNNPGSDCSVNGSACEECQDGVRTRYNSCVNSCS